ncbi:MAG TPA: hypothetical protein PKM73_16090 [Verrucomicrobiota bacterium]|nr:hypothetical protein [Verrucomicrobiota bacterium]HNU52803.1 hypothetical protein [Verrucomicrobiota bacterium]
MKLELLFVGSLAAALIAQAAGDVRVHVVDMAGQPVAGASGARVTLRGTDAAGPQSFASRIPDASGQTTFTGPEIQAVIQGAFGFVIETAIGSGEVRALLYDPFGSSGSLIAYDAARQFEFAVPTPRSGRAAPGIVWQGTTSQLEFSIDLGNRSTADFWVLRAIWQRKAPAPNWFGPAYGLIPRLPRQWLLDHAYGIEETGMTAGAAGTLRLRRGDYDESFPARKANVTGAADDGYELYLVNSVWNQDLTGTYDPARQVCAFVFDPTTVFADSQAPAWDGAALKDGVPYFVTLQAEAWIWHEAGVEGGVAVDWGSGAAASVFHPVRINDQAVRLLSLTPATGVMLLEVQGNANLPYTLEFTSTLGAPGGWGSLVPTQVTTSPFILVDPDPAGPARVYRVRQP